jgi:carbonic anhydrase
MGLEVTSRRVFLVAGAAAACAGGAFAAPHGEAPGLTPAAALAKLLAGNARYAAGRVLHPDADLARRKVLAGGQHPFATIVSCADSRVPPELVFDQGLGDLFVIRVAGNVVDDAVIASAEYAVIHLGCPLVMVLGHEKCGAVTATLEALDGKGSPEDAETHIGALARLIEPAAKAVPKTAPDRLDAAVVGNARRSASLLLADSRPLRDRLRAGRLKVVSARYGLQDGKVSGLREA